MENGKDAQAHASSPRRTNFVFHSGQHHHDEGEFSLSPSSIMNPPSSEHSASMRRAANELLGINRMRSRRSIVDVRDPSSSLSAIETSTGEDEEEASESLLESSQQAYGALGGEHKETQNERKKEPQHDRMLHTFFQQFSAVIVVSLLNMMMAIPFGASYFPVRWRSADGGDDGDDEDASGGDEDDINGTFPLPDKVALGIRMFMFATTIGQIALTFTSKFSNPVSCQMVENVPFLHALAYIVIREQGYGVEALSTLFFLFGLSSVVAGIVFYLLGHFELGRVVYFFPGHVLVGCIGGIGIFIAVTAIEVTINTTLSFKAFVDHFHFFAVVLFFEITLRILMWATQDKHGRPKFQLLTPFFYCLITPMFYLGLALLGVNIDTARDAGYFFPVTQSSSNDDSSSAWSLLADDHLFDIFKIVDIRTVSWTAVFHSIGTMIALAAFSLIHVPINIPAFAISTDVDTDMNAELKAHGYSNVFSGLFGGLQNYMCYSTAVLYAKSGGNGKISSLAISACTAVLFVVGPSIASYLPRCMAGTLLLHIGIDLFLEGVWDSLGNYDNIEYAGIWLITLVMTIWGMTAGLIASAIAALSTYAFQSITFQNPIRQIMTASTLRSSAWNRCAAARSILEQDHMGRGRIIIFQLQGHLFFGNVALLTDTIKATLKEMKETGEIPLVAIVDFTLVVGMDSSAAHAVAKLKKIFHRFFQVEVSMFVTGSDRGGFPCEYALSQALNSEGTEHVQEAGVDWNDVQNDKPDAALGSGVARGSVSVSTGTAAMLASRVLLRATTGRVCESLDEALIFAEDMLIFREKPSINTSGRSCFDSDDYALKNMTLDEEEFLAKKSFTELCVGEDLEKVKARVDVLFSFFKREVYVENDLIWAQGSESDSAKFFVCGKLVAFVEGGTEASEIVARLNLLGELGLVHGAKRLTSLLCASEKAVLYSLSKEDWEKLKNEKPEVSGLITDIVILYLSHRVQHVSNRYFGSTLPV
jgi:SulP family sulfate permease